VDVRGALSLHDVKDDQVVVGLIGPFVAIDPLQPLPADIIVHLGLRPGRSAGGQASLVDGDFSGPDGVKLRVSLGQPTVELGAGGSGLQLSRATPNPFAGETRFSVTLDRGGRLDVGIYDLAGRRIATLFHGSLAAGSHPFTWDGHTDQGGPARGGVYFYRVVSEDASATGRMVLLQVR
jgi:hypothetical protein